MRIRKHGGLLDVTKDGEIRITPKTAQSVVVGGPLNVTGAITNNGNVKQTVTVPLTAAQLIAMGTTPVELIPAPGAGKAIIIDNISLKMTTTATVFTGGGAVEFRYTDASGTKVTADIAAAVITAVAGVSFTNVRGIEASLTAIGNAAVVIRNATAAFAAGTGSAVLVIDYHIV